MNSTRAGFTSWPGMRPQLLQPLFSFSKTSIHTDILLTPLEQFRDREAWDPVWEDKPLNKAIWRGSTTGVWFDRTTWWRSSQRVRLFFRGKDKVGTTRVRFDGVGKESNLGVESIVEREIKNEVLFERYLDFAFSGKQGQCTEEDGTCEALDEIILFEKVIGWNEANEFKYMLDLDGNAWSGRFHRLLSSNSVVLKSTIFPEWYVRVLRLLSRFRFNSSFLNVIGIRAGYNLGSSTFQFDLACQTLPESALTSVVPMIQLHPSQS
jgi:hypothetical protein